MSASGERNEVRIVYDPNPGAMKLYDSSISVGAMSKQGIDCRVFLFYFRGEPPLPDLEAKLKAWGMDTGRNLAVGFVSRGSNEYPALTQAFRLRSVPAIVMTGNESIASVLPGAGHETVFLKMDSERVLKATKDAVDAMERAYHLFLRNEFCAAMAAANGVERGIRFRKLLSDLYKAVKAAGSVLEERDLKLDILKGLFKIELTRSKKETSGGE